MGVKSMAGLLGWGGVGLGAGGHLGELSFPLLGERAAKEANPKLGASRGAVEGKVGAGVTLLQGNGGGAGVGSK
jgi:hypothetical protein